MSWKPNSTELFRSRNPSPFANDDNIIPRHPAVARFARKEDSMISLTRSDGPQMSLENYLSPWETFHIRRVTTQTTPPFGVDGSKYLSWWGCVRVYHYVWTEFRAFSRWWTKMIDKFCDSDPNASRFRHTGRRTQSIINIVCGLSTDTLTRCSQMIHCNRFVNRTWVICMRIRRHTLSKSMKKHNSTVQCWIFGSFSFFFVGHFCRPIGVTPM